LIYMGFVIVSCYEILAQEKPKTNDKNKPKFGIVNKDIEVGNFRIDENIQITEDGDRIETIYKREGVTIYRINTASGLIYISNQVFRERGTNQVSVFTTNNAEDPDKLKFSESSISKGIPTSLNFEEYVDEHGKGQVRIVIDNDILNQVFQFDPVIVKALKILNLNKPEMPGKNNKKKK